ncbi:tripartite motif-containing protein 2 [Plakobranchus ocellatus]|uniref:Tripartite motif-containing protein 2 n=1 Tax=Plakobranchus ocellatus TaxID=259542 RepID=A0AAV4BHT2_9GAST|nr:tripartite motif-containing protein 2 [Plakobranchus ocellatus]
MSTISLRTLIREDHLTCSICCSSFTRPKALPCLHTFCYKCIRDYVVRRGHENIGVFPCPICRADTAIPLSGIEGFPDNHIMSSLSDTVENSAPSRPVPKPRRSLGNTLGAQAGVQEESDSSLPPAYSSVADTDPALAKVCSNDPDWMVVPRAEPSAPPEHDRTIDDNNQVEFCVVSVSRPENAGTSMDSSSSHTDPHSNLEPMMSNSNTPSANFYPQVEADPTGPPSYPSVCGPQAAAVGYPEPAPVGWNVGGQMNFDQRSRSPVSYPSIPPHPEQINVACTENLMLRFGKQGSTVRDFIKPIGLAVSSNGSYVISDNGGNQNRVFIYNSGGELQSAFKCGCKVKDVAMTAKDDILAAVHKNMATLRLFSMAGQCKAEYGKFSTFEEPSGVAELNNGGVVLTGTANHCVYILTNQMKLSVKFGRKGNGDGYFFHPGHVATDFRNHIIVTDKVNNSVQVFGADGKFKLRFGSTGTKNGQLQAPLGVCTDSQGNIIVADAGNHRVEVFSSKGRWLSRVVSGTHQLGEQVRPVNVAWTPTGKVAVLLRGPYFAEVRVYSTRHQEIPQPDNPVSSLSSSVWYSKP